MQAPLRSFWFTLGGVWTVLCLGGLFYARSLGLPPQVAAPVIAAFLWEASFYLIPGFAAVRKAIEGRWRPPVIALCLSASALAPYCAYTVPAGLFRWTSFVLLGALAAVLSFWYLCLPRNRLADAAFLLFVAAIVLGGSFSAIFPRPVAGLRLEILGQLMWTRLAATAVLWFRHAEGVGFGFIPSRTEWGIGIRQYLYFLPVGLPLGIWTGFLRFHPVDLEWWGFVAVAVGTFLGMFWVVALAEEFFFRGLLQQWLGLWLGNRTAGLVLATLAFGLVHLPFRSFPNWRFALVATVAGFFYGRAYSLSGGIRAAMVTHALVNATTRMLFR